MTLYGEVVKLLDSVWDTSGADKKSPPPPPRQPAAQGGGGKLQANLIRTGSTLIEVPTGVQPQEGGADGASGAGAGAGAGAGGASKLKPTPSGSMAAFTQGADPVAGKGTGTPM